MEISPKILNVSTQYCGALRICKWLSPCDAYSKFMILDVEATGLLAVERAPAGTLEKDQLSTGRRFGSEYVLAKKILYVELLHLLDSNGWIFRFTCKS